MKHRRVLVIACVAVVAAALLVVLYVVLSSYEVVNKGIILPYTTGYIYELRILGKYRLYVEPEVRLTSDVVNATIMLGIAYISVAFASMVYTLERPDISRRLLFFVTMSVGMFYLAADELLGIHESLGHNMPFLLGLPGVHRPDDLIIAAYGIPALAFLYYFRSILLKARRPLLYFSAAMLLFAIAAIADSVASGFEEIVEIIVGILLLSGTISLGLSVLQDLTIPTKAGSTVR